MSLVTVLGYRAFLKGKEIFFDFHSCFLARKGKLPKIMENCYKPQKAIIHQTSLRIVFRVLLIFICLIFINILNDKNSL